MLGVSCELLLKPVCEPFQAGSQGQDLIPAARVEPERVGYPPERLRDAVKIRRPVFR